MPDIWLLYSTFATRDEALSVARSLLEKRLIACVTVTDGATSLYRWEGEVKEEKETIMLAKTTQSCLQAASEEVKRLHSYDMPCIIAYPAGGGFPPFMQWVADETK